MTSSQSLQASASFQQQTPLETVDGLPPKTAAFGFSEQFTMKQARAIWPALTKDAQKYIACWEGLAPLALLQVAYSKLRSQRMAFTLPTGCDNTAAEAGTTKLFTTSRRLSNFLQLIARWAGAHDVELQPNHVPGRKNVWADELSCILT